MSASIIDDEAAGAGYLELVRALESCCGSNAQPDPDRRGKCWLTVDGHKVALTLDADAEEVEIRCASRGISPTEQVMRNMLVHALTIPSDGVLLGIDPASGEIEARMRLSLWVLDGFEAQAARAAIEKLIGVVRAASESSLT